MFDAPNFIQVKTKLYFKLFLISFRLLITDVAAGLKMPVIWILTPQQWVPQVYHHIYQIPTLHLCVFLS